ncbi:MAG: helix-turn-helix domain-containing protein [Oscillospiraceae bacterium]|nr:helix-turn-helix domain-containing protein [Oscillospiraceae bacterium]
MIAEMGGKLTFGSFLRKKRLDSDPYISLRELARRLKISPVYMSDIETGRDAAPSDAVLINIAEILKLDKRERELMYDLAAESKSYTAVPADLPGYITTNEYAKIALRVARDTDATDTEWQEFIEKLKKRSETEEKK